MRGSPECWFDHEKLEVYREAILFIAWLSALLEGTVRIGEVKDQLDRASKSIALNIAEGNGSIHPKIAARSLISPMALRSNALPAWTFWLPERN
jgi:23S rRNA-intervening sequence protein